MGCKPLHCVWAAAILVCSAAVGFAGPAPAGAHLYSNIVYAHPDGINLKLDVCVPAGTGPFPVAILVHGGGWGSGNKAGPIRVLFAPLTAQHIVWFSINYRLAPQYHWPDCYHDVQAAIVWVKKHAAEYHGDPGRIALVGYSAGGELVCLAAAQADSATRVDAVVGLAPPTDMVADTKRRGGLSKALTALFGTNVLNERTRALLVDMSGIDYVHAGMPPFLLIHGTADRSVPYVQSIAFRAKLQALHVPCQLITIKNAPHDISKWQALHPGFAEEMAAWLHRTLAGN